MKKSTPVTILFFAAQMMMVQGYVSLEIETLRCSNHKWQEVEYLADGSWLPSPKLTGIRNADYTVTGAYVAELEFDGMIIRKLLIKQ